MTTARGWLIANKDRYTDRAQWIRDCIKEIGCTRSNVYKKAKSVWPTERSQNKIAGDFGLESSDKDIISPDEFLSEIDIVAKVLEFLNGTVKDGYIEDDKLRKRFEISMPRWKEMVKLPILEGRGLTYEYSSGGSRKTVWSSVAGIEAARKTISMARYE